MRTRWWVVALALGIAGAFLVHHKGRAVKSRGEGEDWPCDKNFGAFPPEIPERTFDLPA